MAAVGSCHCQRVRFTVAATPTEVNRCSCSICTRLGALRAYYRPEEFAVTEGEDALSSYSWTTASSTSASAAVAAAWSTDG